MMKRKIEKIFATTLLLEFHINIFASCLDLTQIEKIIISKPLVVTNQHL